MSRVGLGAAIALASLVSIGSAQASPAGLSIITGSDGTSYTLPTGSGVNGFDPGGWIAANNFGINGGSSVTVFTNFSAGTGLFVTDGTFNVPLNITLRFTYEGTEAGYTNVAESSFIYGDDALFVNHGPTAIGLNSYSAASIGDEATEGFTLTNNPGLVPFLFKSITGNTTAINGGIVTDHSTPTAIAFKQINDTLVYAFFDDSGAGPDKDFDDMVVRIELISATSISPAPLPAALPLFASGLGAMGLLGWRRKRKAALAA